MYTYILIYASGVFSLSEQNKPVSLRSFSFLRSSLLGLCVDLLAILLFLAHTVRY